MRKILSIIIGIIVLVAAVFTANYLINNKKKPKPKFDKIVKTVFVKNVVNTSIPIIISTSGNLTAKRKIDLYAEVQGILKPSTKDFKTGVSYTRGQNIISINNDEFYANLQSQKSSFYNNVTAIMPDIRLDFPDEYKKWQTYLKSFDINKTTPKLPEVKTDKEKYFISGRGINTAYYNVKNLEVKLGKYYLRAPFSGILTEALVTPGSLVRVGQKLGEFIDPSIYEMEVSINADYINLLKVGESVALFNLERTKEYTGKVIRVNGKLDSASQTVKAYIQVAHKDLREGTYLEANLSARNEENAIEVDRKLLVNNKQLFIVKDTILDLIDVTPVYFSGETAVLKGVSNGTIMLSKPIPGAYKGMPVKTEKDKN